MGIIDRLQRNFVILFPPPDFVTDSTVGLAHCTLNSVLLERSLPVCGGFWRYLREIVSGQSISLVDLQLCLLLLLELPAQQHRDTQREQRQEPSGAGPEDQTRVDADPETHLLNLLRSAHETGYITRTLHRITANGYRVRG